MSHEIATFYERPSMAYVGDKPWHGLGQELTPDSTIDEWRVEAGLDWEAKSAAVMYEATPNVRFIDDKRVLYRSDNQFPLGIVSKDYKIVQPSQVLEFFRDLTETGGFKMETAGALFYGRKIWALAKTGESVKIAGVDEIKPYLLLATSMDGTMATVAHFTSVRVVCNNTLRMAIGANGKLANVRIPHQTVYDEGRMKRQLGIADESWSNFIENVEILAGLKISRDDAIDIIAAELKTDFKNKEVEELTAKEKFETSATLRNIIDLFEGRAIGANLSTVQGTGWGLVNAVTQYFDHISTRVGNDGSKAFERAHLTDRAALKVSVANSLLDLAA